MLAVAEPGPTATLPAGPLSSGTQERRGPPGSGAGWQGGREGAGAASAESSRWGCYSSRAGERMVRGSAFSSLRWSSTSGRLVPARLAGLGPARRTPTAEAAGEPPPPPEEVTQRRRWRLPPPKHPTSGF